MRCVGFIGDAGTPAADIFGNSRMFIQRLRSTAQLMLCVLCCHGSSAMADSEYAKPVTFAVGDGVTAKAVQINHSHISISVLPGGAQ